MHKSSPFSRITAILGLVAAMTSGRVSGQFAMSRQQALEQVGGYESHGKRKTKVHDRGGNIRFQRQAKKLRNQRRHRQACKG
jgi:hypothetical protein